MLLYACMIVLDGYWGLLEDATHLIISIELNNLIKIKITHGCTLHGFVRFHTAFPLCHFLQVVSEPGCIVMLPWISKSCCRMFNADLDIRVWMFLYYSICKTNPALQTPNKLVISLWWPVLFNNLWAWCGYFLFAIFSCNYY